MTAVSPANCPTKNRLRTRRFYLSRRLLPEDVFYLIEDRGVAVRGLIVHLHCGTKLLDQFPLVTRELRWRHHTHVVVQIAFATPARIGQSLAFDAKHGAALRAFGNLQFFFRVQSRHLQFRTESRLGDAQGNRAIQVRAAPFPCPRLVESAAQWSFRARGVPDRGTPCTAPSQFVLRPGTLDTCARW